MSKLTKKSVDDTNTLPKRYLLWDGELRCFGLLVLPNGVKTYTLQYRNKVDTVEDRPAWLPHRRARPRDGARGGGSCCQGK